MLRYYEEQGLLSPARDASGYRAYTESDVAKVRQIRGLLADSLSGVEKNTTVVFSVPVDFFSGMQKLLAGPAGASPDAVKS